MAKTHTVYLENDFQLLGDLRSFCDAFSSGRMLGFTLHCLLRHRFLSSLIEVMGGVTYYDAIKIQTKVILLILRLNIKRGGMW